MVLLNKKYSYTQVDSIKLKEFTKVYLFDQQIKYQNQLSKLIIKDIQNNKITPAIRSFNLFCQGRLIEEVKKNDSNTIDIKSKTNIDIENTFIKQELIIDKQELIINKQVNTKVTTIDQQVNTEVTKIDQQVNTERPQEDHDSFITQEELEDMINCDDIFTDSDDDDLVLTDEQRKLMMI